MMTFEPGSIDRDGLRAWRKENFLSQRELAEMLGVHTITVSYWETGRRRIPAHLPLALEAISQAREARVRRLRTAMERLAYKRRMLRLDAETREKEGRPKRGRPRKYKP